jgi:hypothetical protein
MESVFSISEILGTTEEGRIEICATADARYDRAEQRVCVTLEAFARQIAGPGQGLRVAAPWLPPPEHVAEHLPREDAAPFAKDVFQSWLKKTHAAVPLEIHLAAEAARAPGGAASRKPPGWANFPSDPLQGGSRPDLASARLTGCGQLR